MNKKKKTILVVDDNRDILEAVQLILEDSGFTVIAQDNGEYVEHLDTQNLPDVILLDLLLSGRNGGELIKILKSNAATQHIPVILNSAHPNAKNTWKEFGADDFIAKPFGIDELISKVEKYAALES